MSNTAVSKNIYRGRHVIPQEWIDKIETTANKKVVQKEKDVVEFIKRYHSTKTTKDLASVTGLSETSMRRRISVLKSLGEI